jgi:hypothetical protein
MKILLTIYLSCFSGLLYSAPLSTNFKLNLNNQCANSNLIQTFQNKVTCCCRISGGGQCCAEVSVCTGGFVPGCFCSNYKQENILLDSLSKK